MSVTIAYTGPIMNGSTFAPGSGSGEWDTTKNEIIIDCTLTLSGSYPTGGDPINFGSVAPPIGASLFSYAPSDWSLKELVVAGAAQTGFQFNYNPGPTLAAPTQAGGVLQVTGGAAGSKQGGVQIDAGTYVGQTPSLEGTVIKARFWFARN